MDTEVKKLWEMTESEFKANAPKGFTYVSNLPSEADVHTGVIRVGPKFFRLSEGGRKGVITHEHAHALETSLTDQQWSELMDIAKKDVGVGLGEINSREYHGPLGRVDKITGLIESNKIGERLTDLYASMLDGDDAWLKTHYPIARQKIVKFAVANGLYVPGEVLKEFPNMRANPTVGRIIPYSPGLKITNLSQLPRGTGARYLEVIHGEGDTLAAKQWRRSTVPGVLLVDMKPAKNPRRQPTIFKTTCKRCGKPIYASAKFLNHPLSRVCAKCVTPGELKVMRNPAGDMPWQMTRREYESRGMMVLPQDHPLMVQADEARSRLKTATDNLLASLPSLRHVNLGSLAVRRSTLGSALEYQPYSIETALRSSKAPKHLKDAYRVAKQEMQRISDVIDNEIAHETIVAKAVAEGKPVPASVLSEYSGKRNPALTGEQFEWAKEAVKNYPQSKAESDRLEKLRDDIFYGRAEPTGKCLVCGTKLTGKARKGTHAAYSRFFCQKHDAASPWFVAFLSGYPMQVAQTYKPVLEANKMTNPLSIGGTTSAPASLYQSFHGNPSKGTRRVSINIPEPGDKLVKIGRLTELRYRPEEPSQHVGTEFFHKLGDTGTMVLKDKPILATGPKGKGLFIIDDKASPKFTRRGIIGAVTTFVVMSPMILHMLGAVYAL